MKKATKFSKKFLSTLLSVMIIVLSCAASFTGYAAVSEDTITALAEALKSDTVKYLSNYATFESTSEGSGSNMNCFNTITFTLDDYDKYLEVKDLVAVLNKAVKETDQYKNYANFSKDASSRKCTDYQMICDELTSALVDDNAMTAEEMSEYNVATFFGYVFNTTGAVLHGNNTKDKNKVPARIYNDIVIKTDDVEGYLATVDSYDEISESVSLGEKSRMKMSRENYTTGWGTNHYHDIVNVAGQAFEYSTTGVNDNKEIYKVVNDFVTYTNSINLSYTYDQLLDMVLADELDDYYNELKEKYEDIVDYVGSVTTFRTLFGDIAEDVEAMLTSCESAKNAEYYLAIAQQYKAYTETNPNYGVFNYGAFDYDEMTTAYATFVQLYNSLQEGGEALLEYLNSRNYIDLDYYNNFTDNIKVYSLAQIKTDADALYNDNKDSYNNLTTDEQKAVYSALCGYIDSIPTYSQQVIDTIFPDGYAYLTDFAQALYCATDDSVIFFASNANADYVTMTTEALEALIEAVPENLEAFNALYDSIVESSGEEKAASLLGTLKTQAEAMTDNIYTTLANRFDSEVDYADSVYTSLGRPTTLDVTTFLQLKKAFAQLEDDVLTYLTDAEKDSLISAETIEKYNNLRAEIYDIYTEYASTYGFTSYEKAERIEYDAREVYSNDKIKTEAYEVTDENLENIVKVLDNFLGSDAFKDLTGIELSDIVTGKLEDVIFTDAFVNTLVQKLYPLITDMLEEVWLQLPSTYSSVSINYLKSLSDVLNEVTIYAYPTLLAENLDAEKYADNITMLKAAKKNWNSSDIRDPETQKLKLTWGIDAAADEDKAEAFYHGLADALVGLKPMVTALLCGQSLEKYVSTIGKATVAGFITTNIDLRIKASGNDGYSNCLVPIFELLGVDGLKTADEMKATDDLYEVAKAIVEPLMTGVNNLLESPVQNITDLLPNLIYALSFNMVPELLNMLQTNLYYAAEVIGAQVYSDTVSLKVGDLIDFSSIEINGNALQIENGLNALIASLGLNIPALDENFLATAGELTTVDTKRVNAIYDRAAIGEKAYYIDADTAQVGYYVLSYLVDLIQDTDSLNSVLSLFLDEEKVAKADDVISKLSIRETGDVIAALTELVNTEKYPQTKFAFADGAIQYDADGNIIQTDALSDEDKEAFYTKYWTESMAKYTADNLVDFVEDVCQLAKIDISDYVNNLIGSLYTAKNAQALVDLVNGYLEKVTSSETAMNIIATLNPYLNIDVDTIIKTLSAYSVAEFEDGNEAAFKQAIVDYITPAVPVLKLFLIDSADSSILSLLDIVDVYGYNGYNNGIIPILEALGCNSADIVNYSTFKSLSDVAMVEAVVNPVFNLIDSLADDPVNNVIALLPNIIFFIDNGGLQIAVDAILETLYVVLDVIRPVYNVDLDVNLNLDEVITDALASLGESTGIKFPGYSELSAAVKTLGTIEKYTSANGTTLYKLVAKEGLTPEFITVVLRMSMTVLLFSDNGQALVTILGEKFNLDETVKGSLVSIISIFNQLTGVDHAMFVLFYTFYGLNTGIQQADNFASLLTEKTIAAFKAVGNSDIDKYGEFVIDIGSYVTDTGEMVDEIADAFGIEKSGVGDFFRNIFDYFAKIWNTIMEFFRSFN